MKRFLTATLAATLLFPSPILANDETMTEMASSADEEVEAMSDYAEYDTEMMLFDEEAINESGTTSDTCTIKFENNGTIQTHSLSFNKDGVIPLVEIIKILPTNCCFLEEPKEIKRTDFKGAEANNPEITLKISSIKDAFNNTTPWTTFEENAPIILTYTQDPASYNLELDSWKSVAKSNVIPKATLTSKLKAMDSTAPYEVNKDVNSAQLTPIGYKQNNNLIVIGYTATITDGLTKTSNKNLANRIIKVKLGDNPEVLELKVSDFKTTTNPNGCDSDGTITVNKETLQNSLNEMAKRTSKNYKFTISNFTEKHLNAYSTQEQSLTAAFGDEITISLTPQSYIKVQFKDQIGDIHGQVAVTLSQIDKSGAKTDGYGKVDFAEKENFMKGYAPLKIAASTSQADSPNKTDWDFTAINFLDSSFTSIPTASIDVVINDTVENYYNKSFKIDFVDSETGKSMPDTRVWSKFFRTSCQAVLTQANMTGDVLPTGYGVALEQVPNSTAKTKATVTSTNQGTFSVSVMNPKAATVYVTKLAGYKGPSEGPITTKPEEPVKPNTPQTPAEQPKPTTILSQGHQVMYRLFNTQTGEHFYTRDAGEKSTVLAQDGWSDEGHGWTAPAISSYPVYRVFNPNSGEHHYTKDKNEYDTLVRLGWNGEGHAFFSADDANNKVTLYRLYNPSAPEIAKHHYTSSKEERDKLLKEGWNDEGTGWFGMPLN